MARYLGPKVKLSRRVGVPIADIPKHTSKRQLNPPGQHGFRGRRPKDYGIRKDEKQKLRYHYNVMEKQFRRYLAEAIRRPGNTGETLLQLLECRLDNVIRRAGLTRTADVAGSKSESTNMNIIQQLEPSVTVRLRRSPPIWPVQCMLITLPFGLTVYF